jgi:HD superfamily phosphohydrolase
MTTIYDSVHGYIDISEVINIIDTPEFQRLRNIKQLGACNFVFPSAHGTRFEHSIGVFYLAERMINALRKNTKYLNHTLRQLHLIKVAALIHDIGHGPFSHLWDEFCEKNNNYESHEYRGIEIFRYMNKKYSLRYVEEEIALIGQMINPEPGFRQAKHWDFWMYQIVANKDSGLDVDKMDYLIRDCAVVGLDINKENIYRVIDSAKVVDNTIAFPKKTFTSLTIFNLFETRFKLHKALYQHHTVRGIELQIIDCFLKNVDEFGIFLSPGQFPKHIEDFCSLDDSLIDRIQYKEAPGHELITALKKRKIYTLVGSYTDASKIPKMLIPGIVDHVMMSYNSAGTNPMDKVLFYEEDDKTSCADPESYIEPKEYCSNFVRLYKTLK